MPIQQLKELQFEQIFQNPIYERYAIKLKGNCCITGDKGGEEENTEIRVVSGETNLILHIETYQL